MAHQVALIGLFTERTDSEPDIVKALGQHQAAINQLLAERPGRTFVALSVVPLVINSETDSRLCLLAVVYDDPDPPAN